MSYRIAFCQVKQVCSLWHRLSVAALSASFSANVHHRRCSGVVLSSSCDGKLWVPEVERGSPVLTYPPGSYTLSFRPLTHCQNCPVSEPQSAFHSFSSAKTKEKLSKGRIRRFLRGQWRQTWRTLEILSLLHWLTPLLTLTMHSTARLRACCTSSTGGTMEMLGIERVTLALKMACWLLLLPPVGVSPSAEWSWQFNSLTQGKHGCTHMQFN